LRRAVRLACLAAVLLRTSPSAAGQTDNAQAARESARRATAAYNLGQYAEASRDFEAAYKLVQDPALLFNVAQSYRMGGEREKALTTYKSYLRTAPPNAVDRKQALRWKMELEATTTASVPKDAIPPSPEPTPGADGAERVPSVGTRMASPAQPQPREPLVSPKESVAVNLQAAPQSVPQSSRADSPFYGRWWFWTFIGVAAAGAATALILTHDRNNPDCLGVKPCGTIP
jgi:tetratricopeptide (TPR) repeat protein